MSENPDKAMARYLLTRPVITCVGVELTEKQVEGLDERGVRRLISAKLELVGDYLLQAWRESRK